MKAVVIGAGIVGASIGYHLAARGADVTLIDKNKPGSGASSHSFAWINAGPKSPFEYHDLNRRSLEMWERFAQKLRILIYLGLHLDENEGLLYKDQLPSSFQF